MLLFIGVLLLLFGGGGFYFGGLVIDGGGLGLILLICLVIYFMGRYRDSKSLQTSRQATPMNTSPDQAAERSTPKSRDFVSPLKVKGDCNIIKGKLKQKRARLTDDKLQYFKGKSEELLGRIQKHTNGIRGAVKESAAGRCE